MTILPARMVPAALATALVGLLGLAGSLLIVVPPDYRVAVDGSTLAAGRRLEGLAAPVQSELDRQLHRQITLTAAGKSWTYTMQDLGMTVAEDQVGQTIREAATLVPWYERLPWSRPVLDVQTVTDWNQQTLDAALAPIRAAVERAPVPATFRIADHKPVITPEVNGRTILTRQVAQAIGALGPADTTLAVPVTEVPPEVTAASLGDMRIRKVIAEWTTQYDPTIPRGENVERAAKAFNGLVIKPGELLSYNGVVGPVDAENGWKEAWVFENGAVVPGVGGGVCQVATTFYGAALRANLEIIERHPHQLAVSYIEPSQDAAISPGYEDLKIRNNTAGYIYVETESGGGRVTFRLYGDAPAGQEVKIESHVLGSRPFTTTYKNDPSVAPGEEAVSVAGHPGLVSEAYRSVYQDGQLVRKDLLSRDSYLPTNAVILTGPSR